MSAASQVRLPVRVEPVQGESALGYALRLAERNGYERWHWLLPCDSAMGALWLGQLGKGDVQALCRLASADPDATAKLGAFARNKAEVELGGSLATPNQFINRRWPKICPACLSERGYLPWAWDLVLWTACPTHGCWLVDKCPGCGQRLSWNRAHVDRCCDRAPLSAMPSSPAPASLVSLMRVMARACGCDGPLPDPALDALVGHLDLNQLAYLIVWLGTAGDWSPKKDRGLLARRPTFEAAAALGTAVAELLLDWPAKFHLLIDGARSVRSKAGHPSTKKDFLSNCFEKKLALRAYDFAQLEFLAYVQRKHPWWRRVSDVEDVAAEPDAMIPQMQAMKASGLSRPALHHRLETGEIQGQPFMWGSEQRWLVSQADLDRWIGQRKGDARTDRFLTRTEAGLALGINKILVPMLHEARLIEGGSVDKHHRTLYSRESIASLLGRFDRLARSANAPEVAAADLSPALDLTPIVAGRLGRGVTTAEVAQAILEAGASPVALDKTVVGLARYLFDGREIAALVKSRRINNGWISHVVLRRMLGCGHDVARFLVQRGLIAAVQAPAPVTRGRSSGACRRAQRISKESADRFIDLHVLGSHLKRQFGLGSVAINRLAEQHSVTPVLRCASPSVEIWLRQDLIGLMNIERASRMLTNVGIGTVSNL